jgi:hypothetical protein
MKYCTPNWAISLLLAGAAMSGCASPRRLTMLAPVGPRSGSFTGDGASGHLRVFSATYEVSNGSDTMAYPHSDYKIYDARGAFLRLVRNRTGSSDELPDRVDLFPGNYNVIAESETQGTVSVPVIIKSRLTTEVKLERPPRTIVSNSVASN